MGKDMEKLAIVIPAFKADFLQETLQSIARQSDRRFRLYIGDDASPDNLLAIIQPFEVQIDLRYHRFETNLGGTDLIAHWKRCIELAGDEEWIWLFSDDDVMEETCVEAFYGFIAAGQAETADVLHFDLEVIDEREAAVWPVLPFGDRIDAATFVDRRIRGELHSTVVEYIFRRSRWEAVGGFERFDLAWCSDDATWVKLSGEAGIYTIPGPQVKWRYSGINISSKHANEAVVRRKVDASIAYVHWLRDYFERHRLVHRSSRYQTAQWVMTTPLNATALPVTAKVGYATYIAAALGLTAWQTARLVGHGLCRSLKIMLVSGIRGGR